MVLGEDDDDDEGCPSLFRHSAGEMEVLRANVGLAEKLLAHTAWPSPIHARSRLPFRNCLRPSLGLGCQLSYQRRLQLLRHVGEDPTRTPENSSAAGDWPAAEADFRAARVLNADTSPDIRRAFLYQGSGRPGDAAAVLEDVVRREPDNLDAWGLLYAFTRERDPALARRALEARARLDPLGAR